MKKSNNYFNGLHGLRFFCALLVLIYHCNDAISQVNPLLRSHLHIFQKGSKAVDFFFILSGFLITFLAYVEIHKYGNFNLKKFFKKRITRIFPLYYLAVLLGFILIGLLYPKLYGEQIFKFPLSEGLLKYTLFLPNLMAAQYAEVGPLRSLWSIGVEEQFYILFPFLILLSNNGSTKLKRWFVALIIFTGFYFFVYYKKVQTTEVVYTLITKYFRFHFILLGCLAGALFHKYRKAIGDSFIRTKVAQVIIWISFIGLLFLSNEIDPHNLLAGSLFILIIYSLSTEVSIISLEYKPLSYLGLISYGIYIYHPYVSICLRYLMEQAQVVKNILTIHASVFHGVVLILTVLISGFSYKFFESYFIRLRTRI